MMLPNVYVFIRFRDSRSDVCTIGCRNNFKIAEIFLLHYLNWSRLMTFSTRRVYSPTTLLTARYKGEGWREGWRWKILAWSQEKLNISYLLFIQSKCRSYTLLIHNHFLYCHGMLSKAFSGTQYRIFSHHQKQRLQWLCRRCTKRCWR